MLSNMEKMMMNLTIYPRIHQQITSTSSLPTTSQINQELLLPQNQSLPLSTCKMIQGYALLRGAPVHDEEFMEGKREKEFYSRSFGASVVVD